MNEISWFEFCKKKYIYFVEKDKIHLSNFYPWKKLIFDYPFRFNLNNYRCKSEAPLASMIAFFCIFSIPYILHHKKHKRRKKKILFHLFIFDFLIIRIHPILVVALFEKVAKSLRALLLLSRILHSSQLLEKRGNKKETQWSDVKFIWKMDVFIFKFYVIGLCLFSFYRTFNE